MSVWRLSTLLGPSIITLPKKWGERRLRVRKLCHRLKIEYTYLAIFMHYLLMQINDIYSFLGYSNYDMNAY